jgi:CheY-like chemotaxis protein
VTNRLFVVDASPAVHRLVEQASGEDHEVLAFKDGPSALEAAKERTPGLIVADYHLEGIAFTAFCEGLKNPDVEGAPAIIALVNFSDRIDEEQLRPLGVKAFLKKPLQADHLLQAMKNIRQGEGRPGKGSGKSKTAAPPAFAGETESVHSGGGSPFRTRDKKPLGEPFAPSAGGGVLDDTLKLVVAQLAQTAGERAQESVTQMIPELVAREIKVRLKDIVTAELPVQLPAALPHDEIDRITLETVEKKLPDLVTKQVSSLQPALQRNLEESLPTALAEMVGRLVAEQLGEAVRKHLPEAIKEQMGSVEPLIKDAVADAAARHARTTAEELVREAAKTAVDHAVKKVVPDLAEEAVKKEIARLTA